MQIAAHRRGRATIIMVVMLVFYAALDLGSKEWALGALSLPSERAESAVCQPGPGGYIAMQRGIATPVVLIEGLLELRYAENCGAAFGMLRTAPSWIRALVFGFAALAACLVLTTMFLRGAGGALFAASVPLVLSGAIGNLVDRVRHGYVVDFILVHLTKTYDWPTFNIADATIFVGVVFLVIDGLRNPQGVPGGSEDQEPADAA